MAERHLAVLKTRPRPRAGTVGAAARARAAVGGKNPRGGSRPLPEMSHTGFVPGILGVEDSVAWSRVQIGCTHQNMIVKRVPYGGRDSAVHEPNPSARRPVN